MKFKYLFTMLLTVFVSAFSLVAQTTISVKDAPYSAKGDGVTNDTAALKKAFTAAKGLGWNVVIPDGTYMVDASGNGVMVFDKTTVLAGPNAVLKAIPNNLTSYTILYAYGDGITINGLTIQGERAYHTGTTGEGGMGLRIQTATNVTVVGVTARDCWGDGFYVSGVTGLYMNSCVSDNNRRQGMSLVGLTTGRFYQCAFKNTNGTLPEDGVDIEPNIGQTVQDVVFTNCSFTNNKGNGVENGTSVANVGKAWVNNITVDGCTATGNGSTNLVTNPVRGGFSYSNLATQTGFTIQNSTATGNFGWGIIVRSSNGGVQVLNCPSINTNTKDGVYMASSNGFTISGCTITNNMAKGINIYNCTGTTSNNTLAGNGIAP